VSVAERRRATGAGVILVAWIALLVPSQAVLWLSGARPATLEIAVEQGAARAERQGIGEVAGDVVRQAIQTQRATRTFWTALVLLGDFAFEPAALALRALATALIFTGLAALGGRPARLSENLRDAACAQGWWVLGLVVRVAVVLSLRRDTAETSLVLILPPGRHAGATWAAMRQLDVFALLGWTALGRRAVRSRQVGVVGAFLACATLWAVEASLRVGAMLFVESGMRLSILPEG
jgi:hypothetical protein